MEQKGINIISKEEPSVFAEARKTDTFKSLRNMYLIFNVPWLPRVFNTTLKKNV